MPLLAVPLWTNQPVMLYHGTVRRFQQSILTGVKATAGRPDTDFGRGFYTTTNLSQARSWARTVSLFHGTPAVVIGFRVDRNILATLDGLSFVRANPSALDYWSLVRHCRAAATNRPNHPRRWYDVVVGPVALAWGDRLEVHSDFDQFSFHTPAGEAVLNASQPQVIP